MSSKTARQKEASDPELDVSVSSNASSGHSSLGSHPGENNKATVTRSTTLALVCEAIKYGDEKHGSSVHAIKKFINDKKGGSEVPNFSLKKAFEKGMKEGLLTRDDKSEAALLTGKYKLVKIKPTKGKPAKAEKKATAKKETERKVKTTKENKPDNKEEKPTEKAKKDGKAPTTRLPSIPEKSAPKPRRKPDSETTKPKKTAEKEPVPKKPAAKSKKAPAKESKSDSETVPEKPKVIRRRRSKSESAGFENLKALKKPKAVPKGPKNTAVGKKVPRV